MISLFQKLPFFYMFSFIRKEIFSNNYSCHKIRMIVVWKISSLIKMKPLQAHTKIKMKEACEVFILT